MPRQRSFAQIPSGAVLVASLALVACSKAPTPVAAAARAPTAAPRPSSAAPAPTTAAPPGVASWDGFLSERLAHGMVYINDANARDSTSAFEAVLFTESTPPGSGPDRPDSGEAWWKPTVDQALLVGNLILAAIEPTSGAGAPSYRYVLMSVIQAGKQRILAQALCDEPAWWKVEAGRSKLCQSVGTCAHPIPESLRGDCQLRFSYDVGSGALERLDGSRR